MHAVIILSEGPWIDDGSVLPDDEAVSQPGNGIEPDGMPKLVILRAAVIL
jgi:hypothetical protein